MNQTFADRIQSYCEDHLQAMTECLTCLVQMETPSSDYDSQKKILEEISERLRSISYETIYIPGTKSGGNILARRKNRIKKKPLQLLIGHCDTVWPVGTLEQIPVLKIEDKFTGPGSFDMKAGITQILYALQAVSDLNLPIMVEPVVFINSDEEIGSRDSTRIITQLARIANRAFILEPPLGTSGKLKTTRKGLARFELTIKGIAAHAGLAPETGASAIEELAFQIQNLFALNDPSQGITVNVGMIEGGISPNMIAPECKAIIDVRVTNHQDAREITKKIMTLTPNNPEVALHFTGGFGRPPMEPTPRNKALWEIAFQYGKLLGLNLEEVMAGGGSDGNTTSQYTATLDGLGTIGGGAHAKHEHIVFENLVERTALLTLLLLAPIFPHD
jgi:glutamate carboxypeptidase